MARCYMGNLSHHVREIDITDFFQEYGNLRIQHTPGSQSADGHAIVEFSDMGMAQQAVSTLNGKRLGGKNVFLNLLVQDVSQLTGISPAPPTQPAVPAWANSTAPQVAPPKFENGHSNGRDRSPHRRNPPRGWAPQQPPQMWAGHQQTYAPAMVNPVYTGVPPRSAPPPPKQEIVRTKYGVVIKNIGEVMFKKLKEYGNEFGDCTFARGGKRGEALLTYSNRVDMMKAHEQISRGANNPPFDFHDGVEVEFEFPATCDVRWKGEIINEDGKKKGERKLSRFSKWGVRIRPRDGEIPKEEWKALKDYARKFGHLQYCNIFKDGSAVVAYPTELEAEYAIDGMNQEEECSLTIDGVFGVYAELEILEAREKDKTTEDKKFRPPGYCVTMKYVGEADWKAIKDYGRQFGDLLFGRRNHDGTGMCSYSSRAEADKAVKAMNSESPCQLPGVTKQQAYFDKNATDQEMKNANLHGRDQQGKRIRGEYGVRIQNVGNNDWLAVKKYGMSFGGMVRYIRVESDNSAVLMYETQQEQVAAIQSMNGDSSGALIGVSRVVATESSKSDAKRTRVQGDYGVRIRDVGDNQWQEVKEYGRRFGGYVAYVRVDQDGSAVIMYATENEAQAAFLGMNNDTSGKLKGVRRVQVRRENNDGSIGSQGATAQQHIPQNYGYQQQGFYNAAY